MTPDQFLMTLFILGELPVMFSWDSLLDAEQLLGSDVSLESNWKVIKEGEPDDASTPATYTLHMHLDSGQTTLKQYHTSVGLGFRFQFKSTSAG